MNSEEKNEKCPYCGATENVIGKQDGYGCVGADKAITFKSQILYHIICLKCGTVIKSFVKNPEKLKVNK